MQAVLRSGGGRAIVNSVLQIGALGNISSFFVIQHVNRSAYLVAHLRANRAYCTLNVAKSWLDETPRFLLLFLRGTSLPSDQCLG